MTAAVAPNLHCLDLAPRGEDPRPRILAGLQQQPPAVAPEFFYDDRGSELFRRITELPEYYPPRAEAAIFRQYADDIAAAVGRHRVVVEPGAGECAKVRHLMTALTPAAYVPLDVAGDFLFRNAGILAREYPALPILAARADFGQLEALAAHLPEGPRLFFYPGSTLGNLTPDEAVAFLTRLRVLMGPAGTLLLGLDRHKDRATLEAAYNDAEGVTAEFNRNLLRHLNRILPADFDPDAYRHLAFYNEAAFRIEMHLESLRDQTVKCGTLTLHFPVGARIHTENSFKYTDEGLQALLRRAGLQLKHSWHDDGAVFGVHCIRAGDPF